jgi:hypothetical protein
MLGAAVLIAAAILVTLSAVRLPDSELVPVTGGNAEDLLIYHSSERGGPAADQDKAPISSYRSRLDECFDVPVREAAACRAEKQTLAPSYPAHLDECFDVSLSELASCREASQAPVR